MTTVTEKPVSEMTTKELEEFLKAKKRDEAAKRERERVKYEKNKDTSVDLLFEAAEEAERALIRLKSLTEAKMAEQHVKLAEYGEIRKNSQGGFQLMRTTGDRRVTRRLDKDPKWDERASKGISLISEFIHDKLMKKDKKMAVMILGFLELNAAGELDYAKVASLMKYESDYDDERWLEGLRLVKEGYSLLLKGFAYHFERKIAGGKWQKVVLNFYGA